MSVFFKKTRQFFSAVTVGGVLVSSLSLSVWVPSLVQATNCAELSAGTRFKVANYPAVYIVNKDHKRMYFPNSEVYSTWYSDYSGIVTIDPICVDEYPTGGGVNYRPGSRLVKTAVSPTVYAVGPNNTKHRITNESTAVVLFGNNWPTKIRLLSDAFDSNLKIGSDVENIKSVNGQLVVIEDNPQVYFVSEGKLKKVLGSIPTFLNKDVQGIRQSMLENVPLSTETTTVAEILADPTQLGGVGAVPEVPVAPVSPVNPITPGVSGTDLISLFSVSNPQTGNVNAKTDISYGSDGSFPWYPDEVALPKGQSGLRYAITTKSSGNFSYSFAVDMKKEKPEFNKALTSEITSNLTFSSSPQATRYDITDELYGDSGDRWLMVYAFVRNNDGISSVPGMATEVDDIAVMRVYVPGKNTTVVPDSSHIIDTLSLYNTNNELLGYANSGYLRLKGYAAKQLIDIPSGINQFTLRVNRSVKAPSANYTYGYIWVNSNTGSSNFDENLAKNLVSNLSFSAFSNGATFNVTDYYRGKYVTVLAYVRNNDGVSRVPNMPVEVDDVIAIHIKIPAKATVNPYLSTAPSVVMPSANQVFVNNETTVSVKFTTVPNSKHYELTVDCFDCQAGNWSNTSQINLSQSENGYVNTTIGPFADGKSYRLRARPVFLDSATNEYVKGAWSDYRYFLFKAPIVVTPPNPTITTTGEISLTDLKALQPKTVDFEDTVGEVITKYVSLYGVTIWSNNGKAIYVNDYNRGGAKTSSGAYSISNNATSPKNSSNDPLYLGFNTPVKAMGFYLVGPANLYGQKVEASITVYGPFGKVITTAKRTVSESSIVYFGFQSPDLIYKVDIDYGSTPISEGIDDLMVVR